MLELRSSALATVTGDIPLADRVLSSWFSVEATLCFSEALEPRRDLEKELRAVSSPCPRSAAEAGVLVADFMLVQEAEPAQNAARTRWVIFSIGIIWVVQ